MVVLVRPIQVKRVGLDHVGRFRGWEAFNKHGSFWGGRKERPTNTLQEKNIEPIVADTRYPTPGISKDQLFFFVGIFVWENRFLGFAR